MLARMSIDIRIRGAAVLFTAVVVTACSSSEPGGTGGTGTPANTSAAWTVGVEQTATPAGPESSEPQLTVSSRGVILSWIERTPKKVELKFSERTASGWTPARTVPSGDKWFLSYADTPTVMRLSNGTIVANWLEETDAMREGYNLRLTYSTDEGKTWARSFLPHHDNTKTQHGFASPFELPGNGFGVIWLDARANELDLDNPDGPAITLRYASFDAAWKQTADTEIDAKVCECCSTTAVVTADGPLAAFRDRSDKEIRDIAVSRFENGTWTASAPLHNDNWEVYACPVNGPMLSAAGRSVAAAWFTVKNDQGQAYAAFSSDAGRTWGTPIRLDEAGSLGRVDVEMLDDGSAVATWVEFAGGKGQFRMRRIEQSGAKSPAVSVAGVSGGRASGFPRVARQGEDLVFAWAESAAEDAGDGTGLIVRTAVARVPK